MQRPRRFLALGLLVLIVQRAVGQASPPCGDTYGTSAQAYAIENAMYLGTAQDCIDAINAAKETRGDRVGCTSDTWTYAPPNTAHPTLQALASLWNAGHAPGLAGYNRSCAELGRDWPGAAVGGYYARLAGYPADQARLQEITDSVEGSQYSAAHAPEPLITYPGVYAFSHALAEPSSPCYRGGVVALGITTFCGTVPGYCPTYDAGPWAGRQFLVLDFSVSPRAYDGGMAYDHGWSTKLMVEAWLHETDPSRKATYEASARLAAAWSTLEPSVRNHNYTSKNIWVLAQLYALTGDAGFKAALEDKLDRNLKPAVLMDLNDDGYVDGMIDQPFTGLTLSAQLPGRTWDGHNANMWYHGINASAAVEAYVAFRDRGDTARAADIRRYAIAMLDNLAWELIHLGTPAPSGAHMWEIAYPLLNGLWKIAAYEGEPHTDWEDAAATLYNRGIFQGFHDGRATASLGLYLLVASGTPYVPLAQRLNGDAGDGEREVRGTIVSIMTSGFTEEGKYLELVAPLSAGEYQWKKNGSLLSESAPRQTGTAGRTLTFDTVLQSDSGTYTCAYDDGSKAPVETYPFVLTVFPAGSLPTAGLLALAILAGTIAIHVWRRSCTDR